MKCHKCNSEDNLIKFCKEVYTHSKLVEYSDEGIFCCVDCYKEKNAMTRFVLMFQKEKIKELYNLDVD